MKGRGVLKKTALLLLIVILVCCSGCREYSAEETKEIYQNNSEIFYQVADICVKYRITIPVSDYKPYYADQAIHPEVAIDASLLTKEEIKILEKCGDIGCESVYYNGTTSNGFTSHYVKFYFRYGSWDQCVVVLLDNPDELQDNGENVTVEEFLRNAVNIWNKYLQYEELNENVYYYRARGDVRESDSSEWSE